MTDPAGLQFPRFRPRLLEFPSQSERRISMAIGFDITTRAKEWFEVIWNRKEDRRLDEFVSDGSIAHLATGDCSARHAFKAIHEKFLTAFPGMKITIEDTIASGDTVVVRWRFNKSPQAAELASATTERVFGMTWMRFQEGKIVEGWDGWNYPAMSHDLFAHLTSSAAKTP
jgi:predicted ester cyclase